MRAECIKVVSVLDPAIDTEAMPSEVMGEYVKKRDMSLLKFKTNMKPTIFHLREIPHNLWESYVMADESLAEQAKRAFQASVLKVENLYQRDGIALPTWTSKDEKSSSILVTDENLVRFSPNERVEIGTIAWEHSYLHPRIEPSYHLPPSSLTCLIRLDFLTVDANPSKQAASSVGASSASASVPTAQPETDLKTNVSVGASDSATAVTAGATT